MINMETSLKASLAQIFSCCPKILSCPKFGGAAAPLAPPPPAARTPMAKWCYFRCERNLPSVVSNKAMIVEP